MENKLARFFRNTGAMRFFVPIGLILIIFGVIMLANAPKEYGEALGTVTDVRQYVDDEGATLNDVDFEFTVDGVKYTNSYSGLSEAPAVGESIKVYYDVNDPNKVANTKSSGIIAPIMIGAGALAIVLSVVAGIKAFRKDRELDEQVKSASGGGKMPEVTPLPKEQLTEYYVSFDGNTLKPGYVLEDANRSVLYEAKMTKNALVGARVFTFTNHLTGASEEHEVGHTATTSYNDEFFSMKSWFKFDGKNIWDLLHERGLRIGTDMHSKFPKLVYTVSKDGRFAATVETSGKYVHEEDEAQHKLNVPIGKYYYRVWTNEKELDNLFLTVFAISETEQAIVE